MEKKKKTIIFLLIILLSIGIVYGLPTHYTIYSGSITLGGTSVTSGTVTATINSIDAGSEGTVYSDGTYKIVVTHPSAGTSQDVGEYSSNAIIFSLSSQGGYSSINALSGTADYDPNNDGTFVTLNLAFTGTPTAEEEAPAEGVPGRGGGAMASKAITPEALTKVDITAVPDIIASLPEGWVNVDVYQVGTPTTETVTETLAKGIENALTHATKEKAISVLQTVQNKLTAKEISRVSVTKTLDVYKVTNKDTGQSIYRSKITLTFTAAKDMKNVKIVEVVSSSVVDSIEGIHFPGIKPEVLQTNPIFQWTFDSVNKDETKTVDYIIKKKIDETQKKNIITIAAAEEKIEKKPIITKAVIGIIIIVIIVLVGLVIYYQYLKKKEGKGKRKRKKR